MAVLEEMVPEWREGKIFLVRGSHGAYIGWWISGKYVGEIDPMAMMNPTIHYSSTIHSTDIPDIITTSAGVS